MQNGRDATVCMGTIKVASSAVSALYFIILSKGRDELWNIEMQQTYFQRSFSKNYPYMSADNYFMFLPRSVKSHGEVKAARNSIMSKGIVRFAK